jgi:hypothetical protein
MAIIFINGSVVFPIIFAAGSVFLDLDMFRYALNHETKISFILIRFTLLSMVYYPVWQILSLMFILMIVFLHPPLRLMSKLARLSSTNKEYFAKLFRRQRLEAVFRIHSEVYLLCNALSQTLNFLLPFLLLMGIILCVICDFATIRFLSGTTKMPWFLGTLLIILSLHNKSVISVLFPQASGVFENSANSLRGLKNVVVSRHEILKLRAIRNARISFGSLFHAKKSTKCSYFQTIFDTTVNAVLLF